MLTGHRFLITACIVLLPITLFGILVAVSAGSDFRNDLEEQVLREAQETAGDVDRQVANEISVLSTLALSASGGPDQLTVFRRYMRRALDANRSWRALALIDVNGTVAEEHIVEGARYAPYLKPDMVREVLRTGAPQIGALPGSDNGALTISVPVGQEGPQRAALALVVPANTFLTALTRHIGRQAQRLMLVDTANRFIACASHTGDCSAFAGQLADSDLAAGMAHTPRGFFLANFSGVRFWATHLLAPVSGWTIVAGTPMSYLEERNGRTRNFLLIGGLAAAAIGFAIAALYLKIFIARDMAERKIAALESERESERRLSGMARSLPGLGFRRIRYADGWVHLRCIADADNIFHLPVSPGGDESAAGEALQRMMVSETARRWEDAFERTAATLTPLQLEGELVDPTGRLRRFRANASVRQRPDGTIIWDGVVLDITDLHEAELARRLSADQLAFALECADAGIWEWDIVSNRCTWSDSFWRLMGYGEPSGEPSLEKLEQRLHPADVDTFWAGIDTVLAQGGNNTMEYRFRQPDGTMRWISSRARTTVDLNGMPVRINGLDIDITRLKRFQEELRLAKEEAEQANVAKSRFLAAASHDLRQPVQSLMLFVHLLRQRLTGHPEEPLVASVQQALDVLKELLDSILDLSRLDAGVIEAHTADVPANAILSRIASEYGPRFAEKGLSLKVRLSDAVVFADPMLLGRVLGNLVENALKYTARGGVLVGARRHGDRLRFEVWDTGVGIPANRVEEIFGEFVQLDNPERDRTRGLGLGLAIVRRLTSLLDYPLTVRSRPGRGSVFTVSAPMAEAAPQPVEPVESPAPAPARIPAVVIDDEQIILEGLQAMLEDWDCSVVAACDLDGALRAVERAGMRPELLVVDYRLRGGQTGLDAVKAFRERFGAGLRVILLSGDTQIIAPEDAPGVRFARKPIAPNQLRALFAEVMGGPNAQSVTNSAAL